MDLTDKDTELPGSRRADGPATLGRNGAGKIPWGEHLPALDGLQLAELRNAVAQGLKPLEQRNGLVDRDGDLAGVHAGQVVRPVQGCPRAGTVPTRLALGLLQSHLLLQQPNV